MSCTETHFGKFIVRAVYGFPDKELHQLKIDRIEVSIERFGAGYKDGITNHKIVYLATTTDNKKFNSQSRFTEDQLFTEEEVKTYVDEYFKNRKNS